MAGFVAGELDPDGPRTYLEWLRQGGRIGTLVRLAAEVRARKRAGLPGSIYLAMDHERVWACSLRFGPTTFHRVEDEWALGDPTVMLDREAPHSGVLTLHSGAVAVRSMHYDAASIAVLDRLVARG